MPRIIDIRSEGNTQQFTLEQGVMRVQFQVIYTIEGDTQEDAAEYIILDTPDLPQLGELFGFALCISVSAEPVSNAAMLWEVTCDFDSKPDARTTSVGGGGGQTPEDPTTPMEQRFPRYTWNTETWEQDLTYDRRESTGYAPLVTPTGEPIVGITAENAIAVYTIERYEIPPFNPQVIWDYVNKVNEVTWAGFAPFTVLLSGIVAEEETHSDVTDPQNPFPKVYLKVTYTLKIRDWAVNDPDREDPASTVPRQIGWDEYYPLKGWQEFRDTGTPPITPTIVASVDKYKADGFPDPEGRPVHASLDKETGYRKPDDEDPDYVITARYPRVDFGPLNLAPAQQPEAARASGYAQRMIDMHNALAERIGAV